ncbi:hypothetical protein Sgleb_48790 [Streptomyces glebosus]|uniref:Uncharacterized protein n=1 Tax=Streptomyces glebosus TaxID=249580 RepID=A0A640T1A0_9ACTN|nr:hypothetical protein Sgleb_48790 [Streptomyces glebosus]GHG89636.1 hypothetical protein GCM10010513_72360 [Streptomyces glebosus]
MKVLLLCELVARPLVADRAHKSEPEHWQQPAAQEDDADGRTWPAHTWAVRGAIALLAALHSASAKRTGGRADYRNPRGMDGPPTGHTSNPEELPPGNRVDP